MFLAPTMEKPKENHGFGPNLVHGPPMCAPGNRSSPKSIYTNSRSTAFMRPDVTNSLESKDAPSETPSLEAEQQTDSRN